jgi:type VI secretion system protein ImpJ
VVVAAKAVVVPLTRGADTLFGAAIADARCFDSAARWFIGVRSSLSMRDTIVAMPQLSKVCARRFVLELTRRAVPGFTLEHVPSPPAGSRRAPSSRTSRSCEQVRATRRSRRQGDRVYVPDSFGEPVLELAVLVPG